MCPIEFEAIKSFKIFVIVQSKDGRKFNRGALLNIGAQIVATEEGPKGGDYQTMIMHDVDLLPIDEELLAWYCTDLPKGTCMHLAAHGYKKYQGLPAFLGGALAIQVRA